MSVYRIGVIIGSTRSTRICPRVAQYVVSTLESEKWRSNFALSTIDLQAWNLPMLDEPEVPALIKDSESYQHEHSRKWSKAISSFDAFIFIAPQYNWGYPACLKNAIDYLFNEWAGKPAMIITYGGHGGQKCYAQLSQVLEGLNMKLSKKGVLIPFPTRREIVNGIPEDFQFGQLSGVKEDIIDAFANLLTLL